MLGVGQFLDVLFTNHTLPCRGSSLQQRSLSLPQHHHHHSSGSGHAPFSQPLYSCPTYSQLDFLRLILNIFSGVPEAYQVLRCQTSTTEEELSLFLKRAEQHHAHYLMLGVNRLPFKLQESLVQVHLVMQGVRQQEEVVRGQVTSSTLHFVETAPSMLREMPWIQYKDTKVGVVCCHGDVWSVVGVVCCHGDVLPLPLPLLGSPAPCGRGQAYVWECGRESTRLLLCPAGLWFCWERQDSLHQEATHQLC